MQNHVLASASTKLEHVFLLKREGGREGMVRAGREGGGGNCRGGCRGRGVAEGGTNCDTKKTPSGRKKGFVRTNRHNGLISPEVGPRQTRQKDATDEADGRGGCTNHAWA